MNRTGAVLAAAALLVLLAGSAGAASASTPGYADYQVVVAVQGQSKTFTVNETVAATSNPAYDNLILKFASGGWTLNYSRSVNSSDELSPFVPAISNQTFSWASGSGSVTANLVKNGTVPITFQGASDTLNSYSITGSVSANGSSAELQGGLTTFSSGLVDSAHFDLSFPTLETPAVEGLLTGLNSSSLSILNGLAAADLGVGTASLTVTLLSTSYPLNTASPSETARVASVGVGAGALVSALAVGLVVRRRGKHAQSAPETRPEHWVD